MDCQRLISAATKCRDELGGRHGRVYGVGSAPPSTGRSQDARGGDFADRRTGALPPRGEPRGLRHVTSCRSTHVGDVEGGPTLTMEFVEAAAWPRSSRALRVPDERRSWHAGGRTSSWPTTRDVPDLKTGNVFDVDGTQDADFGSPSAGRRAGLTRRLHRHDETMAPEQALGLNALDRPAADIYALGAILYETLRDGSIPGEHIGGDAAASRRTGAATPQLERDGPARPGGHLPQVPAQRGRTPLPKAAALAQDLAVRSRRAITPAQRGLRNGRSVAGRRRVQVAASRSAAAGGSGRVVAGSVKSIPPSRSGQDRTAP